MMKSQISTIYLAILLTLPGCAARLKVAEISPDKAKSSGVVLNSSTTYSATMTATAESPLISAFGLPSDKSVIGRDAISGVDVENMICVDVKRMPFANSKLSVTLGAQQSLSGIIVGSDTGLSRALDAKAAQLDAKLARRKARIEAQKEADDE